MTCIVGVKTESGVLLGGDSLGSNGWNGQAYRAPKVFRLTRQVAAGYTSSFRMGQLLQHHVTFPALSGDELAWAIKHFIPAIRATFKDHGYAHVKENTERGGEFLLAVRDRLFTVQSDFSVLEAHDPYTACGCGEPFALGAMNALWKPKLKNPRVLLKAALDAASAFSVGVGPPYSFTTTSA